jgi:hypothetical protein
MRFQKMLSSFELLIIDELGFVPPSKTGAELLFESLAAATNAAPRWSPATCRSTNGRKRSDPSGGREPCWTGSPVFHKHVRMSAGTRFPAV